MPTLFWTGELSFSMKMLMNISNILAWITGNARDTAAMKERVKLGYEGAYSDHVAQYDIEGTDHYRRIAATLLENLDVQSKEVLDVGCGTGILSLLALRQGAAKVVCGDLSEHMLEQCRQKATIQGYDREHIDFCQLDSESLPFADNSFDTVLSSMVLGLVPDQEQVVVEMTRVLRSGGSLALSTHGPGHYMEAIDAALRATSKRYLVGYRIEFWPRKERELRRILSRAGLLDIQTHRLTHSDSFDTGEKAYDFFASTSASWWYSKFPPAKVEGDSRRIRAYFEHREITTITQDVIFACGHKP